MAGTAVDIIIPCPRGDIDAHIRHWDFDDRGVPRDSICRGPVEARLVETEVADLASVNHYRLESRDGQEIDVEGSPIFV